MNFAPRKLAFLLIAGLVLFTAGCGSKNKGKIEGKWKVVSGAGLDEQAPAMEQLKAYVYFDFRSDGTLVIGVESTDPQLQELLTKTGEKTSQSCKYKLLSGEGVEVYNLPKGFQKGGGGLFGGKDKARTNATIDGDNMTLKDPDGTTVKLVRIK